MGFWAQLTGSTGSQDVFTHRCALRTFTSHLIPEFIGCLPVIATVQTWGYVELVRVMTEPKNALVSQYQYLSLDGVEPERPDAAIEAVAPSP